MSDEFNPDQYAGEAFDPGKYSDLPTEDNRPLSEKIRDPKLWKKFIEPNENVVQGSPPLAIPATAIPKLAKIAEYLNSNGPKRIGISAAQGAYNNPDNRVMGAIKGALYGLGGETLSKILGGVGDVTMQAAVGRNKFTPGVGTTLADEGVFGTRKGMLSKVASKLEERASQMSDITSKVPGTPIKSPEIAVDIAKSAVRPYLSNGIKNNPSAQDLEALGTIKNFVEDIAQRGPESASQAWGRRIAAGQREYKGQENPGRSIIAKLSKAEQAAYSDALKRADPSGELAKVDEAYAALAKARHSLKEPLRIPKSALGVLSQSVFKIPGAEVLGSAIGQGLVNTSQISNTAGPMIRQYLYSKDPKEENKSELTDFINQLSTGK